MADMIANADANEANSPYKSKENKIKLYHQGDLKQIKNFQNGRFCYHRLMIMRSL